MKNKKNCVLVTGADGFIGSHLVDLLLKEGFQVRAFVAYNSFNSWGWLDSYAAVMPTNLEIFAGDIRDPNGVMEAMSGVSVVYHLAALIAIPFSYHSPDSYVDTNVKGTLNILQAAKRLGTARVLVTSTSEVYGTAITVPISEDHPKQAQSPYSATKIAADALADSFVNSFEMPITIVRPFNTYGPRQSARAFIPTVITQLCNGSTLLKLGDTTPTRDLVFVHDTAKGFLKIAQQESLIGEHVNIATGVEYSVGDVAKRIADIIGVPLNIETDEYRLRPAGSEVFRLLGDCAKLLSHTTWSPATSLNDGLQQTIAWFSSKENLKMYKSNIYNL